MLPNESFLKKEYKNYSMELGQIQGPILQNINEVVYVCDLEMNILYMNPTAEKIAGLSLMEAKKKKCHEVFKGENLLCKELCPVEKITSNPPTSTHDKNKLPTLSRFETIKHASISPLYKNQKIIGAIVITKCTAEQKQVEPSMRFELDKLVSILDSMKDGVYIVNQQEDIEYVNPVLEKEFGKIGGRKCYEYFHDHKEICEWCKNKEVFAGKTVRWEWYSHKNQKTYDLIDTPLKNPDGSVSKLEIFRDITDRIQMESALKKSEKVYRDLVDNAMVGIFKTDLKGNVLFVNQELVKMLEFDSQEEMASKNILMTYKNQEDRKILIEILMKKGKVSNFEIEQISKKKNKKSVIISASLEGEILSGMVVDITERKIMEKKLERLATLDTLTEAYNRSKLDEILKREIDRIKRFNMTLSMLIFDIDHFKEINDKFGHLAGDKVLKKIADIVRENIRKIDYFVRWGGEEFIIIVPETDLAKAEALAERIRQVSEAQNFEISKKVTLSFGVTNFKNSDTIDTFLKRADDAMYLAKRNGRNRVEKS